MAITPYVASLSGLMDYIRERLGEPVIRVEVTDDQIRHCINDCIERFTEYAHDGTQLRFKNIPIVAGTKEYTMSTNVQSIIQVFNTTDYKFDAVFPGRLLADQYGMNVTKTGGLFTLELARQEIELVNFYLKIKEIFDYNSATKTLYFLAPPATTQDYGILYWEIADYSDETSPIYDHSWIKRYSIALVREQWGVNLTKYSGSPLPMGLTMDAQSILQKAQDDKEKLEDELINQWSEPVDFFIG